MDGNNKEVTTPIHLTLIINQLPEIISKLENALSPITIFNYRPPHQEKA